ncbi:hypothetical protein GBAR_LOCUS18086 [Geodia barretti]|nr:hypothetical protein GBAR_LOCUS18086 [Geodia barretti]
MIAAMSGRTDITKILLEGEHINLDIKEKRTGRSALHFSAEEGDSATTEALLKAGANPHHKDKYGVTAMELAPLVSQSVREMMTTLPSRFASQRAVRRLKSESKDLEGDDTSSMLKLEGQELESEGRDPTAGQQSQVRKKMTPEMDPEHSPDFDL